MEGAILAGGASRRMNGQAKGLLPIGGEPIVRRIAAEMRRVCGRVRLAAGSERQAAAYRAIGLPPLFDAEACIGPLAGLHAALTASEAPLVWVSACDMPFASARAAVYLAQRLARSGADAAVPRVGGRAHPLQAVYRVDCARQAEENLMAGDRRLLGLLERLDVVLVEEEELSRAGIDLRFAVNVNTPEDYSLAAASWGE